jgi:glycosyltransferase involved in cell wall biosynthesis
MAEVEVVLPVLNEEKVLARSVRTLHRFLGDSLSHGWRITIADNGSTDATQTIARGLAAEIEHVGVVHIAEAGRGRALSRAWLASDADVLAYMDIDLSTGLEAFPRMVEAVARGECDIVAGTRLGSDAQTTRSLKREVLSRGFVFLINTLFRTHLRDTQCGFKAISRHCARQLLPLIEDTGWFWDTELLLLAEKGGWRVGFLPVRWIEDTDSRVRIAKTVWRDLRGLMRMRHFDWTRARKSEATSIPAASGGPARAGSASMAADGGGANGH